MVLLHPPHNGPSYCYNKPSAEHCMLHICMVHYTLVRKLLFARSLFAHTHTHTLNSLNSIKDVRYDDKTDFRGFEMVNNSKTKIGLSQHKSTIQSILWIVKRDFRTSLSR